MATKKATKKEFKMEQVFAMWKKQGKNGTTYFSGKLGEEWLVGFYNSKKKNPKEPDVRIYKQDNLKEEFLSLWMNVSKGGKKFLSGKLGDKRIVGFINNGKNENAPYFSCYYSEEGTAEKKEEFMEVPDNAQEELPF
jgi:uncharacterized protein (DUF736 family)